MQEFRVLWIARLFFILLSLCAAWLLCFFISSPGVPHEAALYGLMIFALFSWAASLTFTGRVKLVQDGILFERFYPFPPRLFRWDDISSVQANIVSNLPRTYVLVPRDTRRRVWGPYTLGPWFSHYKTLLREILEHVSPSTTIAPEILDIVNTDPSMTSQDMARVIYARQQEHQRNAESRENQENRDNSK